MSPLFEDFGGGVVKSAPRHTPPKELAADRFDDGYNAGWDDAIARAEAEQSRIGEQLANRLADLEREHLDARDALIADLEPALREVFDKLLPHAVERAFLTTLLDEVRLTLDSTNEQLRILVSPEDVAPMLRLLDRADIPPSRATVASEPALAMAQALVRWTGQERRIDLEGVLSDLDSSLDTYFSTLDRAQNALDAKEA